ncbi:class I SAM-dependent methyltransferase [Allobranchiibius sp. GilTou38]|uniref:class I SAM-dependent methyltransferase n=1 Tax=Allobranchiibius sp. GilTou38 TaxID=2815210 RepID=UPI001AA0DCFE|nr:class I SAM-dependent methyltransferase [Allobranchiibius sp. GilTou38]MBO1766593.1 class I SAM-dependent methyltransferase [Allobranchiibius sp. GilTou38]
MDTTAFFTQLQHAFPGEPQDTDPVDPRWAQIAQDVTGFTGPNELAVLNVAASVLPDDESYLEVGTFKGRSLCAAVQGNASKDFFVMENFLEFGMAGQEARAELEDNLERYAGDAAVHLLEGDCFRLMAQLGTVTKPVGVYFYDGEHTLLAHYLALAVAEPLLADEALVLVDDASWPVVQRAHRLFLRRHPGWTIAATWDAAHADDPRWSNGLHALVFKRTANAAHGLSRSDEALRVYQTQVQDKLNTGLWKAAGVFPGPLKAVAKVVLGRSRAIAGKE